MRSDARRNESSALDHARREERAKWEGVLADKDANIAELEARLKKQVTRLITAHK